MTASRSLRRRLAVSLAGFGGLAVASIVLGPLVGSTSISLRRAFDASIPFADNVDAQIFFVARLPRTLAGALVGGTLAAAGVVFQGLLRNPLATPFTLGVSSGAALGAMLAITFGWTLGSHRAARRTRRQLRRLHRRRRDRLHAGAGAARRPVDQRAAARRRDDERVLLGADPVRAVLRGFRRHLPHPALADGRPRRQRYQPLVAALPLLVVSFALFAWLARPLNLLSLGVDSAETHGLDVRRAQRVAFFSASLATGAAVSVGGPIGFVGIIVPHLVRPMVGAGSPAWCSRRRRSSARRSSSAATSSRGRCWRQWSFRSGSSRRSSEGRFSSGCWSEDKTADRF